MEWANLHGNRIRATRGSVGFCPTCGSELMARCGEVNVWHWAHRSGDCDPWSERETQWHLNWKSLFPVEWQEVVMPPHRADVKTPKMVVELQHSPISPEEIREREEFYGDMVWLFDLREVRHNVVLSEPPRSASYPKVPHPLKLISWSHARQSWAACTKPVLVHLARGVLYNIFGFGVYSRLNLFGGFARRMNEHQFMAAIGAGPLIGDGEPNDLYPFKATPTKAIAEIWRPYWRADKPARSEKSHFRFQVVPAGEGRPPQAPSREVRFPILGTSITGKTVL